MAHTSTAKSPSALFQALEKEVGDAASVQAILSGTSNWRGRQQQIITLQEKVHRALALSPSPSALLPFR